MMAMMRLSSAMEWLLLGGAMAFPFILAGLVILFIKRGSKRRLALLGGLLLALAGVFAVLTLRASRVFESYEFASSHAGPRVAVTSGHAGVSDNGLVADVAQVPPSLAVPAEPWKSVADLGFDANLHPSAASASESLVVQVLRAKDSAYPGASFKRVQVWKGENIGSEVLPRVVTRLQREHPGWEVMPEAAEPAEPLARTDDQAAAMQLELVSQTITHQAPWDHNRAQHSGIMRLRLTWNGGSLDRSTQFVEKPWVENASEFVSAQPQMRWVVGYSPQDVADSLKAREQAAQSAAVQILPAARARLAQMGSAGVDDRWLLARIQQDLLQMNNVRDRFTQTVITPYGGQVVREAILVASPPAVQRVVSDCQVHVRGVRSTWAVTLGSAAGMCLLISLVALLLNSITKGYYRGRIMVLAGLLAIAGVLVAMKSSTIFVPRSAAEVVADSPDKAENRDIEY